MNFERDKRNLIKIECLRMKKKYLTTDPSTDPRKTNALGELRTLS